MNCPNCGNNNVENAVCCGYCGTPLNNTVQNYGNDMANMQNSMINNVPNAAEMEAAKNESLRKNSLTAGIVSIICAFYVIVSSLPTIIEAKEHGYRLETRFTVYPIISIACGIFGIFTGIKYKNKVAVALSIIGIVAIIALYLVAFL